MLICVFNMYNINYIEKWIDRKIKSIIKFVELSFVCNNYNYYPRSGRNSLVEPIADLIIRKVLTYNEKVYFLNLKYFFNYPNSQLSQIIFNYTWFKTIIKS